jgi:hypothetical protein
MSMQSLSLMNVPVLKCKLCGNLSRYSYRLAGFVYKRFNQLLTVVTGFLFVLLFVLVLVLVKV